MGAVGLLILVIAAGLVAGRLRGGSLAGLRARELRARRLGLAGLAVQALIVPLGLLIPDALGPLLLAGALVALLLAVRANGRLPGAPLIAIGLLANLVVLLANWGMPVTEATLRRAGIAVERPAPARPDARHVLTSHSARLAVLGDRFAVRPLRATASAGDVAQLAGIFLLIGHLMAAGGRRPATGTGEARPVPWSTTWADE